MIKENFELTGENLTIENLHDIIHGVLIVKLSKNAQDKINRSAQIVQAILDDKKSIYGITTGFGYLQKVNITSNDTRKLQENLIVSHSAGVGSELSHDIVKGMIALKINKFARGHSGIRLEVVDYLLEMLNRNIIPSIPSKGSLGASGDLTPLAHLSLVLLGKGYAYCNGQKITGKKALKSANLEPLKLIAKEGLALLNGTQAMTSVAALSIKKALYLVKIANIATALSMEIHKGNIDCLHPLIHQARPHDGQMNAARMILNYLEGSQRVQQLIGKQDAYSLRCAPAVHGAVYDTINHARIVTEIEMNASTDNPLLFSGDQVFSGGNFHGEPIAFILDFLAIALTELGNISERRTERLLNPTLSNLPAFLTPNTGLNSGLMIAQYTAAALASENKQLSTPASIETIPVSADQEDHVSMGMNAANKILKILNNLQYILSIELLCASQALDIADAKDEISPHCKEIYETIRSSVPMMDRDRELTPDIEKCTSLIRGFKI
jgi:histidine ammonia-lyase